VSAQDITRAATALEGRLNAWGVDSPAGKAREFINNLIDWGWQMSPEHERRPHPPKPNEVCPYHPGGHRDACRGCRADQLAGDAPPRLHEGRTPAPDNLRDLVAEAAREDR